MSPRTRRGERRIAVSVVLPVSNEAEALAATLASLREAAGELDADVEFFVVDDGSADSTSKLLEAAVEDRAAAVRYLRLSRPFGREAAISAGLDHVTSEVVVVMEAGFSSPGVLGDLFFSWEQGMDVVFSDPSSRSRLRRRLFGWSGQFGLGAVLMDRRVVDAVRSCGRGHLRTLLRTRVGFRQGVLEGGRTGVVHRRSRAIGDVAWAPPRVGFGLGALGAALVGYSALLAGLLRSNQAEVQAHPQVVAAGLGLLAWAGLAGIVSLWARQNQRLSQELERSDWRPRYFVAYDSAEEHGIKRLLRQAGPRPEGQA